MNVYASGARQGMARRDSPRLGGAWHGRAGLGKSGVRETPGMNPRVLRDAGVF